MDVAAVAMAVKRLIDPATYVSSPMSQQRSGATAPHTAKTLHIGHSDDASQPSTDATSLHQHTKKAYL